MNIAIGKGTLLVGDCLETLKTLPDNSVDSVVTDPPYGLSELPADKIADVLTKWVGGDRSAIPTGKGFMGKSWDAFVPPPAVWDECMRVLKPGGHLLAFSGSRTVDLMMLSIRLSGFEVRDTIHFSFGSGFPKSHNPFKKLKEELCQKHENALHVARVSEYIQVKSEKAKENTVVALARTLQEDEPVVLMQTGKEESSQEAMGMLWSELTTVDTFLSTGLLWSDIWDALLKKESKSTIEITTAATTVWKTLKSLQSVSTQDNTTQDLNNQIDGCSCSVIPVVGTLSVEKLRSSVIHLPTAPASAIGLGAKYLSGTGTAAKPSHEPIVVARKPLTGTVAQNVQEWGTGALNIDGSRVGIPVDTTRKCGKALIGTFEGQEGKVSGSTGIGRWPANTLLTHNWDCEQTGIRTDDITLNGEPSDKMFHGGFSGNRDQSPKAATSAVFACTPGCPVAALEDQAEASRFFAQLNWSEQDKIIYVPKPSKKERNAGLDGLPKKGKVFNGQNATPAGKAKGSVEDKFSTAPSTNSHPTVKPVKLMEYLIKLVTPPGGIVLDPFLGSGTTAVAAENLGFSWKGCELTEEYLPIIKGRVTHANKLKKAADTKTADEAKQAEQLTID